MITDTTCKGLMAPCGARAGLLVFRFSSPILSEPPRLARSVQRLGDMRMRFRKRKFTVFGKPALPSVEGRVSLKFPCMLCLRSALLNADLGSGNVFDDFFTDRSIT